jgi:hypothetical protein
MPSTAKLKETDPHDVFSIAPDVVPAAWADKVLADITRDTSSRSSEQPPAAVPRTVAAKAAPTVDTTFRATAVNDLHVANDRPVPPPATGRAKKSKAVVFVLTLCSALIAAAWQHYGVAAKQMFAGWKPPFHFSSSPPTEKTGLGEQPDAATVQASAADQAASQDATAAQPAEASVAVPSPDAAQMQSMARDMAAMGQEIQLLKASIAELKTSQQAMAVTKPAEIKPAEAKPVAQAPRPKVTAALPPRPLAPPPVRRPATTSYYPPAQSYPNTQAAAPPPPQQYASPAPQPMPPPPVQAQFDGGEPVPRPPLALH